MAQIIALFNDQKEAEQASNALESSTVSEKTIRIIEEWGGQTETKIEVLPPPNLEPGMRGVPLGNVSSPENLELSDEEEQFFRRSVQKGGVLVVVDLEGSDEVDAARQILNEQGGRLAVQ